MGRQMQARDARASAMAQRRKAMAVAPKKRPPVTISGRSRAGSGITMKVHRKALRESAASVVQAICQLAKSLPSSVHAYHTP
jgi:hypothetical protein